MEIKDMDKKVYYYDFEIYHIEEALKKANTNFLVLKEIVSSDKNSIIAGYHSDFKNICNKLISKSISTINEYVHIIDALIIINNKIKQAIHDEECRYRKLKRKEVVKKLEKINKECDNINKLIGAESTIDLILDVASSTIAIVSIVLATVFFFVLGVLLNQLLALIISAILLIMIIILATIGRKMVRFSFSVDKAERNIYNHAYMKSIRIKQVYRYANNLIKNIHWIYP